MLSRRAGVTSVTCIVVIRKHQDGASAFCYPTRLLLLEMGIFSFP